MPEGSDHPAATPRPSFRARLAGLRVDVTPLRTSRDFRLLFSAGTVFYLGGMVSYVALPYQIYQLTGSNFAVGAMGLVELVPLVVFGLYGGALADHVDRRTMLVLTGDRPGACSPPGCSPTRWSPDPQVWAIYVIGALLSVAQSLQRPSRDALLPRIVRHDELPAAVALSSLGMQIGMLLGPALGGLLVGTVGVPWAYGVDVVGLAIATVLFARDARATRRPTGARRRAWPASWRASATRSAAATCSAPTSSTWSAMFLAMPIVLFPALATGRVRRSRRRSGCSTPPRAWARMVATLTQWLDQPVPPPRSGGRHRLDVLGRRDRAGRAGAVGVVRPGLPRPGRRRGHDQRHLPQHVWNQTIPDEMRGRLAGIEMLSYSVGPLGGQARSGLVADLTTVRTSIVSGGILCVLGVAATAAWLKDFWRYDAQTDEHAVRERSLRAVRAAADDS